MFWPFSCNFGSQILQIDDLICFFRQSSVSSSFLKTLMPQGFSGYFCVSCPSVSTETVHFSDGI